jgi:hypothetical protein
MGRPPVEKPLHPTTVRLPAEIMDQLPPPGVGDRAVFIRAAIEEKLKREA